MFIAFNCTKRGESAAIYQVEKGDIIEIACDDEKSKTLSIYKGNGERQEICGLFTDDDIEETKKQIFEGLRNGDNLVIV